MRQVTLLEPGRFVGGQGPPPEVPAGSALVRPRRVGICGTDLHAFAGRQPFFTFPRVLGHELGVEVVTTPPGDHDLRPGDRCAIEPYLSCGQCHSCRLGKPNCCETLQVLGVHTDGGMCGQFAVPVEKLHRSDLLSLDQLALVETLGIGYHAVERGQIRDGESVLIVGAGPIGLAAIEFAVAAGGRVRVLDLNPQRRAFAAKHWPVETLPKPDGTLAEIVIDATGNAQSMEASFELVAFGGRLVFVGIVDDRVSFFDPLLHRREMTVLASRNSAGAFPEIIRRMETGKIDTTPWITHRLALAEVPERFADISRQPGLVKAMVEVTDADA
jgi:2-desacetyl-2-hydroxyethyl bacteriochlorophyllide A dehydrogenase